MKAIVRVFAGLLICSSFSVSHANTIDLALVGTNGASATVFFQTSGFLGSLSVLSPQSPVSLQNGDTVNVTLTLNSPITLIYPYGLSAGSVPNEYLTLDLTGSVSGTAVTAGTMTLYLNNQLVETSQLSSVGTGLISDGASFHSGAWKFDAVESTFTVSGLTAPAVLEHAALTYDAFQPTQLSPPVLNPVQPIEFLPAVPEPSTVSMFALALMVLGLVDRRRRA